MSAGPTFPNYYVGEELAFLRKMESRLRALVNLHCTAIPGAPDLIDALAETLEKHEKARAAEESGLSGKLGRLTTKTQALAETLSTVQGAVSMLARVDACGNCGFAAWMIDRHASGQNPNDICVRYCEVCRLRSEAGKHAADRQVWALERMDIEQVVEDRCSVLNGKGTLAAEINAQIQKARDGEERAIREATELRGRLAQAEAANNSLVTQRDACLSIAEGVPGWREYAHVRPASAAVACLRNEVEALRAENARLLKDKRELTDKLEGRFKQEYQITFAPRPSAVQNTVGARG